VNAADVGVAVILVAVVVFGLRHGLIGQILLLAATIVSALIAGLAAYLVAAEGDGSLWGTLAAPVAFFVALSLSSLLTRWLARGLTGLMHRLPFASLDRLLGACVSVIIASIVLSILVLGVASLPFPNPVTDAVRSARSSPWLLEAGLSTSRVGSRFSDLFDPIAMRYEEALATRVEGI